MAIIEIDRDPSPSTLNWFGVVVLAFLCFVALVAKLQGAPALVSLWLSAAGAAIAVVYYSVPPLRRPLYLGWMYLVYPIGWTVSHLLLALVFYVVITPIGFCLRLLGRDPLKKGFDRSRASYWISRRGVRDSSRYFRQF